MRLATVLFVCLAAWAGAAQARDDDLFPPCAPTFGDLFADPVFKAYPVKVPTYRLAPPNLKSGRAHYYRTTISTYAARGADFAGHYTISFAGCGTLTSCVAFIDQRSGQVYSPRQMLETSRLWVDMGNVDYEDLHYKLDSNLLILVGSTNEDPKTEGVSYYLWRHNRLRLIRRFPIAKLCGWPNGRRGG